MYLLLISVSEIIQDDLGHTFLTSQSDSDLEYVQRKLKITFS